MNRAFFPGSFDPPTNGHLNMIQRASAMFDELYVVVANNPDKKPFLSADTRLSLLTELIQPYPNVHLVLWDRLVVDFAREYRVPLMVRGVRALADFSYEFESAMINRTLMPELEVLFLPTDPQYFVLRSSVIREILSFGGDITSMVPDNVARLLMPSSGS